MALSALRDRYTSPAQGAIAIILPEAARQAGDARWATGRVQHERKSASSWCAIAGAVAIVSAALPWVTVSTVFGSISKNGIDGDGLITAVLGASGGLLAWRAARKAQFGTIAIAVLICAIGIYDWANIARLAGEAEGYATASTGMGLYGTILAGIALGIIAVARLKAGRQPDPILSSAPFAPPSGPPIL